MRFGRSFTLAAALLAVSAAGAQANPIVNGGFEAGLNGWTLVGNGAPVGVVQDYPVPEATQQALLTNDVMASNIGDLEALVGVPPFGLDNGSAFGAVEGSGLGQSITVMAGDVLSFSWAMLTNEGEGAVGALGLDDYVFVAIDGQITLLASVLTGTFQPLTQPGYQRGTARATAVIPFLAGGTYFLSFGVVDIDDTEVDSALLLDSVTVGTPVPEPGLLSLFGAGAAALLGLRRRRA
jgi:hypothetical protein